MAIGRNRGNDSEPESANSEQVPATEVDTSNMEVVNNVDEALESKAVDILSLSHRARQDAIAQVTSLTDLRAQFGAPLDWQEIEPSFDVVSKATFEGIPFVLGAFRINDSKKFATPALNSQGEPIVNEKTKEPVLEPVQFVSMLVAGYDPESETLITPWVIVNDGSTGIRDQLQRYVDKNGGDARNVPVITCSKGLRKSEYPYTDSEGKVSEATTWYIG